MSLNRHRRIPTPTPDPRPRPATARDYDGWEARLVSLAKDYKFRNSRKGSGRMFARASRAATSMRHANR
jgi:hypothetical protein